MGKNKILVVDDSKTIRTLYFNLLSKYFNNFFLKENILFAINGVEALEQLEKHHNEVSIVISDVFMPKMGGGEFILKAKELYPEIIFLIGSDKASKGEIVDLLKYGAFDFIDKKNFQEKIIVEKIKNCIKESLKNNSKNKDSKSEIEEIEKNNTNYLKVFDFIEKSLKVDNKPEDIKKFAFIKKKFFNSLDN